MYTNIFNVSYDLAYRIYSRISREILDKIKTKFYQFDLYEGQLFGPSKRFKFIIRVFYDFTDG